MAGRKAAGARPVTFAQTPGVDDPKAQRALDVVSGALLELQARGHAPIVTGNGAPENVVEAPVGTLYLRRDGGTGSTLYVKESGTGASGWIAK